MSKISVLVQHVPSLTGDFSRLLLPFPRFVAPNIFQFVLSARAEHARNVVNVKVANIIIIALIIVIIVIIVIAVIVIS